MKYMVAIMLALSACSVDTEGLEHHTQALLPDGVYSCTGTVRTPPPPGWVRIWRWAGQYPTAWSGQCLDIPPNWSISAWPAFPNAPVFPFTWPNGDPWTGGEPITFIATAPTGGWQWIGIAGGYQFGGCPTCADYENTGTKWMGTPTPFNVGSVINLAF